MGFWIRLERERVRKARSLHHCVDHGCATGRAARHEASLAEVQFASLPAAAFRDVHRYDEDARTCDPEDIMIDSQTASFILVGVIGAILAIGGIGTVLAFWSMGRAGYRKD
jgi:hypothetical protein